MACPGVKIYFEMICTKGKSMLYGCILQSSIRISGSVVTGSIPGCGATPVGWDARSDLSELLNTP